MSSTCFRGVLKTIVNRAVTLSGTDTGAIFYCGKEVGGFELGETIRLDEEIVDFGRPFVLPGQALYSSATTDTVTSPTTSGWRFTRTG